MNLQITIKIQHMKKMLNSFLSCWNVYLKQMCRRLSHIVSVIHAKEDVTRLLNSHRVTQVQETGAPVVFFLFFRNITQDYQLQSTLITLISIDQTVGEMFDSYNPSWNNECSLSIHILKLKAQK